ncbi:VWA domain-containing protein [Acidobacteriota bacterium]
MTGHKKEVQKLAAILLVLTVCMVWKASPALGTDTLTPTEKVMMLRWETMDETPYYRIKLDVMDPSGDPVNIDTQGYENKAFKYVEILDVSDEVVRDFKLMGADVDTEALIGRGKAKRFITLDALFPGATGETKRIPNETLLLFDTSGSMNIKMSQFDDRRRFDVAKEAVKKLLEREFEDGVDSIAIAPFESHEVKTTIDQADFTTSKYQAIRTIDSFRLEGDKSKRNTALYCAAAHALDKLKKRRDANQSRNYALIIMTDGKNEIWVAERDSRGRMHYDDPVCVPDTLKSFIDDADRTKIQIFTVGFGPGSDEVALRQMRWPKDIMSNFILARGADDLKIAFKTIRTMQARTIQVIFKTDDNDFARIKEKNFIVRLKSPEDKIIAQSGILEWHSKSVTAGSFDGDLSDEEKKRIKENEGGTGRRDGDIGIRRFVIKRLLILVLFSAIIAIFWVGVPMFVFPRVVKPKGAKGWAGMAQGYGGAAGGRFSGKKKKKSGGGPKRPQPERRRTEKTVLFDPREDNIPPEPKKPRR